VIEKQSKVIAAMKAQFAEAGFTFNEDKQSTSATPQTPATPTPAAITARPHKTPTLSEKLEAARNRCTAAKAARLAKDAADKKPEQPKGEPDK
jgi:hypothetical protein